jgi:hypothetical protein
MSANQYGRAVPSERPSDSTLPDSTLPDSTLQDVRSVDQNVRGHNVRRVTIAVLAVIVVLGAIGVFGMRSATVRTTGDDGYQLSVTYARVSRAGLDSPWRVQVTHPGGFSGPITLATTVSYFTMFETQGLTPQPVAETVAGRYQYQQFSQPAGDTFTLTFDAYIQPSSQRGRTGRTALIMDGHEVARVSYRTRLVP